MRSKSKKDLCSEFARILGGSGSNLDGVCLVCKFREIPFTYLGKRKNSTLVNPQFFSFENLDPQGNAKNLAETVLLQEDVNLLLTEFRKRNLNVTSVHNNWLSEEPLEIYFDSIEPPLEFARKVRKAFRVLKK